MDQEAVKLLANYRDDLLPKKMKENNGIYKRYNVEWIGREGDLNMHRFIFGGVFLARNFVGY